MVTRSQKCGATKEMQYLQQDLEATPPRITEMAMMKG